MRTYQIGTYKLPVTWEVYDTIEIEATSLEEAVKIFEETKNDMELPDDPKYVDDSFQLSTTKVEELKLFNSEKGGQYYYVKNKSISSHL